MMFALSLISNEPAETLEIARIMTLPEMYILAALKGCIYAWE